MGVTDIFVTVFYNNLDVDFNRCYILNDILLWLMLYDLWL